MANSFNNSFKISLICKHKGLFPDFGAVRNSRNNIFYRMYSDISEEWRDECEHIKLMSEPLELQEFGLQRI